MLFPTNSLKDVLDFFFVFPFQIIRLQAIQSQFFVQKYKILVLLVGTVVRKQHVFRWLIKFFAYGPVFLFHILIIISQWFIQKNHRIFHGNAYPQIEIFAQLELWFKTMFFFKNFFWNNSSTCPHRHT